MFAFRSLSANTVDPYVECTGDQVQTPPSASLEFTPSRKVCRTYTNGPCVTGLVEPPTTNNGSTACTGGETELIAIDAATMANQLTVCNSLSEWMDCADKTYGATTYSASVTDYVRQEAENCLDFGSSSICFPAGHIVPYTHTLTFPSEAPTSIFNAELLAERRLMAAQGSAEEPYLASYPDFSAGVGVAHATVAWPEGYSSETDDFVVRTPDNMLLAGVGEPFECATAEGDEVAQCATVDLHTPLQVGDGGFTDTVYFDTVLASPDGATSAPVSANATVYVPFLDEKELPADELTIFAYWTVAGERTMYVPQHAAVTLNVQGLTRLDDTAVYLCTEGSDLTATAWVEGEPVALTDGDWVVGGDAWQWELTGTFTNGPDLSAADLWVDIGVFNANYDSCNGGGRRLSTSSYSTTAAATRQFVLESSDGSREVAAADDNGSGSGSGLELLGGGAVAVGLVVAAALLRRRRRGGTTASRRVADYSSPSSGEFAGVVVGA